MKRRSALDGFFAPESVAVIGATDRERSVGRTVMANLCSGTFKGKVYPVNPARAELMGLKCWPRIGEIPEQVDLAVIITPAPTVPALIRECVERESARGNCDFGGISRTRRGRSGAGTADSDGTFARRDAIDWTELSRRDESARGIECHVSHRTLCVREMWRS